MVTPGWIYIGINILLVLACLYALYFASFFWLGTEEQHRMVIAGSGVSYFVRRFLLNLIPILVVIGLVNLFARMLGKRIGKDLPVRKISFTGDDLSVDAVKR
jgi:hypothetical protein